MKTSLTINEDRHALKVELDPAPGAVGASRQELDAWLERGMGGYSSEALRDAFSKVQDAEHWKNDIDAVVPAEMRPILEKAVPFHTGGPVEFQELGDGNVRVTAPGYWTNGMEG